MKYLIPVILTIFLFSSCFTINVKEPVDQDPEMTEVKSTLDSLSSKQDDTVEPEEGDFDEARAKALGADDYGMKKYVIAFLKEGPNRNLDSLASAKIQAGHMANIKKMANEGKLVVAGPFLEGGDLRGIYIFNVETLQQAEALTHTDPAIEAGTLVMELKEWYGSAALMEVNATHEKITKISF